MYVEEFTVLSTERYQVNLPKVIHEIFDEEVILINLESGSYYSLSASGTLVWRLAIEHRNIDEMVDAVTAVYNSDGVAIAPVISDFVSQLMDEQLLVNCLDAAGTEPMPVTDVSAVVASVKLAFEPPVLRKYTDMQQLLLLDPIHEVDETGWPNAKQAAA